MSIEIRTRHTGSAFVAVAPSLKQSASHKGGARQAAESLARQLGLNPDLLREIQRDLLRHGHELFSHPGVTA
jgi:hypothetical protein